MSRPIAIDGFVVAIYDRRADGSPGNDYSFLSLRSGEVNCGGIAIGGLINNEIVILADLPRVKETFVSVEPTTSASDKMRSFRLSSPSVIY